MWRHWSRQSGLMLWGTGLGCWQLSSLSGRTTCPGNLPQVGGHQEHQRAASVAARAGSSLPADAASAAAGGHSVRKDLSEDLTVRSCKGTLQLLHSSPALSLPTTQVGECSLTISISFWTSIAKIRNHMAWLKKLLLG